MMRTRLLKMYNKNPSVELVIYNIQRRDFILIP